MILGPLGTVTLYLGIAYLTGRREPQEFVAAACGFLVGLMAAVYFWFPQRGPRPEEK